MKNILSFVCFFFITNALLSQSISGKITEFSDHSPIRFAEVTIYQDGKLITGQQTDVYGDFNIKMKDLNLESTFSLKVEYVGYKSQTISDINFNTNKDYEYFMIELGSTHLNCCGETCIVGYEVKLINLEDPIGVTTYKSPFLNRIVGN